MLSFFHILRLLAHNMAIFLSYHLPPSVIHFIGRNNGLTSLQMANMVHVSAVAVSKKSSESLCSLP